MAFVADRGAVASLWNTPGSPVARDLLRRGLQVESQAKVLCPVDQGRLRASISTTLEFEDGLPVAFVAAPVGYAAAVHEGARPHWPPPGPLQAWARRHGWTDRSAGFLIGRAIAQRGTIGRPFLRDALGAAAR